MNWYKRSQLNKISGKVHKIDNLAKQIAKYFFESINRGMKSFSISIPYGESGYFTNEDGELIVDTIKFKVWKGMGDKTLISGATQKAQEYYSSQGMRDSDGFISIDIYKGGPSKEYLGIHPSERESVYMRLLNVVRHELEHVPQKDQE